nr:uncharacterized protein LOC115263165 [Aedes albopictus]
MELDNNDFDRLKLRTKVIKLIQRLQKELYNDPIEERLEDTTEDQVEDVGTDEAENSLNGSSNYQGITLDSVIDINVIFRRAENGKTIIEQLKEGHKPDDVCMTEIKRILCDYLKAVYGLRPSAYHKNILAQSLVKSYPAMSSSTPDVPQSLWFHPNGRGKHRHCGRLHYHMEYLARSSGERVINRTKLQPEETSSGKDVDIDPDSSGSNIDLETVNQELKFLCPGPNTKLRADELWRVTFNERKDMREKGSFYSYLQTYPVATAFNGAMISLDFRMMFPNAPNFREKFEGLQSKILTRYAELFKHVKNDFIRTLMIIRQKCPSRGAKRTRDADPAKDNILKGIIEWIKPEDPYPISNEVPILYVKGDFMENGASAAVAWKGSIILMEGDINHCFQVLCEALLVFNSACQPTDKQFYTFIWNVFCGVGLLTTTGERLLNSL